MPKKSKVSDSGDQLEIPQDHIIEVSYSKAKQLMKQPREMSEKQRDNIQRLVAMNKEKKEERDRLKQEQERSIRQQAAPPAPKQKLIVKPKRIFKKKQELPPAIQDASTQESDDYDDETDEEVEEVQTFKRPQPRGTPSQLEVASGQPKPKINKIVEMESKLKQIEQSINKPVQKISKYDSMMSKFFSKK